MVVVVELPGELDPLVVVSSVTVRLKGKVPGVCVAPPPPPEVVPFQVPLTDKTRSPGVLISRWSCLACRH